MNPALDDAVARLGMALLHFIWQGAVIGCVAAAGLALLRNARPQARYAWCGAALLMCLVLPLWQTFAPSAASNAALTLPVASAPVTTMELAHAAPLSASGLRPGLPAVVLVWSIGAGLMSLRMLMGLMWLHRLGHAAALPVDPVWHARMATLARRMGLRRLPILRVLDGLDGPITLGRWRPLILLPASLLMHMPPELLEALLAHELAHIRRLDFIANLLQSLVEVLLFYHPVVWWLSRRIRHEREQIADDLAAEALGEPRSLAIALSALAQFQSTHPPLALAAQGGHLVTRIRRLVRPIRQPLGWKLLLPIVGMTALAIAAHASGLTTPATPPTPAAPASPAAQPVPAKPAEPVAPSISGSIKLNDADEPFAFALISADDGRVIMSGRDKDVREARAQRASINGAFLWVRQGKQRYVVTDAAAVAQAESLWVPFKAVDADIEQLSQKIEAQAQIVDRMTQEIAAIEAAPSAELEALQAKMTTLQKQHDKAQSEVDKLSRKIAVTRDEKRLAQLEQQSGKLEAALEPINQAMQALGEQMDRISDAREQAMDQVHARQDQDAEKVMEDLSRQMEALSEKQELALEDAKERLRVLVDDLLRRGMAKRV